jgi:hypothetical protein
MEAGALPIYVQYKTSNLETIAFVNCIGKEFMAAWC